VAEVFHSSLARQDLKDIWRYVALENRQAATGLLLRIEERVAALREFPLMGSPRPDLGLDLRALVVGKYLVIHRIVPEGVEIIRVLHGARHLPSLL
jgi:toxin ParE1/3/4